MEYGFLNGRRPKERGRVAVRWRLLYIPLSFLEAFYVSQPTTYWTVGCYSYLRITRLAMQQMREKWSITARQSGVAISYSVALSAKARYNYGASKVGVLTALDTRPDMVSYTHKKKNAGIELTRTDWRLRC